MATHCPGKNEDGEEECTVVTQVKMFRNLPELRWERRIHEQIIPAIRRANGEIAWSDVFVVHAHYDTSPEGQRRKLERDLYLLNLELQDDPNDPFTLFNLGMTYENVGRLEEAADYLRRCLAHSKETESHLRKAYALLVSTYTRLAEKGQEDLTLAWETCRAGLALYPLDAELRFRRAAILR